MAAADKTETNFPAEPCLCRYRIRTLAMPERLEQNRTIDRTTV